MPYEKKDRNELLVIVREKDEEIARLGRLIKKEAVIIDSLRALDVEAPVEKAGPEYPSYAGICPACGTVTNIIDSRFRCKTCGKRIAWDHPVIPKDLRAEIEDIPE